MLQVSFSLPPWMRSVRSRQTVCSGDTRVLWRTWLATPAVARLLTGRGWGAAGWAVTRWAAVAVAPLSSAWVWARVKRTQRKSQDTWVQMSEFSPVPTSARIRGLACLLWVDQRGLLLRWVLPEVLITERRKRRQKVRTPAMRTEVTQRQYLIWRIWI